MAVSMEIVPFSESLDMYGEPDRYAAYSLSGHIAIALSPSASFFEQRHDVSILLRSLSITFEGQTEMISEDTGYVAFRLCSVSQELIPGEPVNLSTEGGQSTWNIIFNLAIPGWLPATSVFGENDAGTRYSLFASATLDTLDDGPSRSWLSTLCAPFRTPIRAVDAPICHVQLNRYMAPSSASSSLFPFVHYHIARRSAQRDKLSRFPCELLNKIQVQVSVPEHIDIEEDNIPFSVRLRGSGLSDDDCSRLRVSGFSVEVEQMERYRNFPLPSYCEQFPVPTKMEQPPYKKLLSPHSIQSLYELGFSTSSIESRSITRMFSLLHPDTSGQYAIAGNGYIFTREGETSPDQTWFALQTTVPLASSHLSKRVGEYWKRKRDPRPSSHSPFLSVHHRLHVTLTCTYDVTDSPDPEQALEYLEFDVPLKLVHVPPAPHELSRSPSPTVVDDDEESSPLLPTFPMVSKPYAQALPAYSQLYDHNGDRKIDYSVPLPLYTPSPSDDDLSVSIKDLPRNYHY